MKRFKKVLAVAVCTTMVASLLAGCGEKKDPVESTEPSPSAVNSAEVSPSPSAAADPASFSGKVSLWHFNKDEAPNIEKYFEEVYKNVDLQVTVIPDKDQQYINKLTSAVRAGAGVPDIFTGESAFVKRIVEMPGAWADISEKAKEISGDMAPYTIEVGTDTKGVVRAISHQVTAGGIGYKRPVAKKYLGTDDPTEVAAMLSSQDKIVETAKKLKDASGGKVALFPSWEEMKKIALGGRSQGWVVEGKLYLDQKVIDLIEFSKTMRDNKYELGFDAWSPGWSSAIAADEQAMCWAIPTWGIPWIIGSNDKKAKDGGRWGVANAPMNYFWGGTWYGMYDKTENKDLAWEFIKYWTSDKEHHKSWNKATGDIPNSLSVLQEGSTSSDVDAITGQNLFKFYQPMVGGINGKVLTQYDDTIENAFNDVMKSYLAGKIKTKDEVISTLKTKVKQNLKDITVE
jgi:ABC-type glycerol-3-phosphate transport system substrate-binding protein